MTGRVIGRTVIGRSEMLCPNCSVKPARVPERRTSASRTIYPPLRRFLKALAATIREIFDEPSYERYLARAQDRRSVASYRAFLQERETGIARKPRCC
jgi:hypothetical protein